MDGDAEAADGGAGVLLVAGVGGAAGDDTDAGGILPEVPELPLTLVQAVSASSSAPKMMTIQRALTGTLPA